MIHEELLSLATDAREIITELDDEQRAGADGASMRALRHANQGVIDAAIMLTQALRVRREMVDMADRLENAEASLGQCMETLNLCLDAVE